MNIEQLYHDYNIPFVTEGHKHASKGWINTVCPFCTGNPGYHLGYDTIRNKFVCWRCGGKYADNVISKLLNVSHAQAKRILQQYGLLVRKSKKDHIKVKIKPFKLPANLTKPQNNHIRYLIKRDFDPNKIIEKYNLFGSGVSARLGGIDYKHRLIIPFSWDGQIVTFDSRDITDKSANKYMACPKDREIIPRKNILYGIQSQWKSTGICVEGITDVWRLGDYSFATCGINYTPAQIRCIKQHFNRVAVLFDNEPQAIEQAKKLIQELRFRNVEAFQVPIEDDPAALTQDEADYLVKQIV